MVRSEPERSSHKRRHLISQDPVVGAIAATPTAKSDPIRCNALNRSREERRRRYIAEGSLMREWCEIEGADQEERHLSPGDSQVGSEGAIPVTNGDLQGGQALDKAGVPLAGRHIRKCAGRWGW